MTYSAIFSSANIMAMIMWLLMIILPKWRGTRFLIDYKVIPILLSAMYGFYVIQSMIQGGDIDFSSLASVMDLFTKEDAMLAGWLHYLAFDLLIGMWMLNQNQNLKIHPLLMLPCLFGTFMLGPVGFLLFTGLKFIKNQTV